MSHAYHWYTTLLTLFMMDAMPYLLYDEGYLVFNELVILQKWEQKNDPNTNGCMYLLKILLERSGIMFTPCRLTYEDRIRITWGRDSYARSF